MGKNEAHVHVHVGFPRPPLSHVMGFQVVVLPPCFARPPQLVVRCGARTCIDGIVARFSAHGFLIFFSVRVCSLTWKVVVMIFGHADRSAKSQI